MVTSARLSLATKISAINIWRKTIRCDSQTQKEIVPQASDSLVIATATLAGVACYKGHSLCDECADEEGCQVSFKGVFTHIDPSHCSTINIHSQIMHSVRREQIVKSLSASSTKRNKVTDCQPSQDL